MIVRDTNWAGNIRYQARRWHQPACVAELQELVASSRRVRPAGTGHSFNLLADADTNGDLVSLDGLPPAIEIDRDRGSVSVTAGLRYGEVAAHLDSHGYALANLASLPHISVAGACATATHGSGAGNGNLATSVRELELVTGDGELVRLHRDTEPEQLNGAVVGLGALGLVTRLALDIQPRYQMVQYVYDNLPWHRLSTDFEEITTGAYSVSLFTDWTDLRMNQVWRKERIEEPGAHEPPPVWHDATLATAPRHPIPGADPRACTDQGGRPGPWHQRLPHFRLEFTPSHGEELQSEFFVATADAVPALTALAEIRDSIAPVLQICEIRRVAADHLWLSPAYQRDSVAIHFTWKKDTAAVTALLPAIEKRLARFGVRPHWGKVFTMAPEVLADAYPRLGEFGELRRRFDPSGTFRNAFLDRYLPGDFSA